MKEFALRMIRPYISLPKTTEAQVLRKQMLRSGTSVSAQYREDQRAKSDADFINKVEGSFRNWMKLPIDWSYSKILECLLVKS